MSAFRWLSLLSFLAASLFPLGVSRPPAQVGSDPISIPTLDHYGRAVEKDLRLDPSLAQASGLDAETASGDPFHPDTKVNQWSKVAYQFYYSKGWWRIALADVDQQWGVELSNEVPANSIYPEPNRGVTRVVFLSNLNGPDYDIWIVNADGTKPVALTNNAAQEEPATWSSDGNWLAFASNRDGNWEIYRMRPDGTEVTRLTNAAGSDFSPTWSPDGSQIAWVHSEPGSSNGSIWIMDASGANPVQVISGLVYLDHLHWSPDGSKLAFSYDDNNDGWLACAWMALDGLKKVSIIEPYHNRANSDEIASSWAPDNSGLVCDLLFYASYQGEYYLRETSSRFAYWIQLTGTIVLSSFSAIYHGIYPMNLNWAGTDSMKPESWITVPTYSPANNYQVIWGGADGGTSGFRGIDIQTSTDGGPWANWLSDTPSVSGMLSGQPGQTISFRSRARDYQYNQEAWHPEGTALSTHLYTTYVSGKVLDNRGQPVPNASLALSANSWEAHHADAAGTYSAHMKDNSSYTLSASHPGYVDAPQADLPANSDQFYSLYLSPADNLILNGSFDNNLDHWTVQGSSNWFIFSSGSHSGTGAVMANPNWYALPSQVIQGVSDVTSELIQTVTLPADMHRPTLSFLYKLSYGVLDNPQNGLRVSVSGDCATQPFSVAGGSTDWLLGTIDLTGCEGKTVTVHLGMDYMDDGSMYNLYIDEVSLGSWRSPKMGALSPTRFRLTAGSPTTLTLTGENFDVPMVTIGGVTLSAVVVDEHTLTVDLSGQNIPVGIYDVIVTNADGSAAAIPGGLQIGERLMLPTIKK